MTKLSELLLTQTAKRMPRVDLRSCAVLVDNLIFAHQLMVASEQLVDFAVHRLETGSISAFERALLVYLREHVEEERGHAEWLARDLVTAGVIVATRPTSWDAVQIVGAQYYQVLHGHPVALLGYMAVLEGSPMPTADIEALEALHGPEMLRTLRFHAEHDIDHASSLRHLLDQVPAALQESVVNSAEFTVQHYTRAAAHFGKEV